MSTATLSTVHESNSSEYRETLQSYRPKARHELTEAIRDTRCDSGLLNELHAGRRCSGTTRPHYKATCNFPKSAYPAPSGDRPTTRGLHHCATAHSAIDLATVDPPVTDDAPPIGSQIHTPNRI